MEITMTLTMTLTMLLQLILWSSSGIVLYAYVGYPLVLWLAAKFSTKPGPPPIETGDLPFVSLIIAAYKEDKVIVRRLTNALGLNYPPEKYEVLIGCDGNEDLTGELVKTFDDPRIRLIQYPVRSGKASVLNETAPQAR